MQKILITVVVTACTNTDTVGSRIIEISAEKKVFCQIVISQATDVSERFSFLQ
jgi:hypothetical protein